MRRRKITFQDAILLFNEIKRHPGLLAVKPRGEIRRV